MGVGHSPLYITLAFLGTSPMVWRNLSKGNHTASVEAFCLDYQMRMSTVQRKLQFEIL